MADDGGLVGGREAPPRGPVEEEPLHAAVRAAVAAEAADLRAAVDAGLRDLAARADEILGGGLGDLAIRFGEQLKTLQTAAATSHDDRRIDAQTANRVRAMEDRLDELIGRLDAADPMVPDGTSGEQMAELERALESATRRLSDRLDRGIGRATSRVDEVEVRSRQLEEGVLRLEAAVAGVAEMVCADEGTASFVPELEKVREAITSGIDRLSEAFDEVVERVDVLEQLFALIVEGDPQREAEQRRQLIVDFARAMSGHLCAECGYVAGSARGLTSHERVHRTGSGGETDQ